MEERVTSLPACVADSNGVSASHLTTDFCDDATMKKLTRSLTRTVIAAVLFFGILTVVEIHWTATIVPCAGCAQQSSEFSDAQSASHQTFFQRASSYRIVDAARNVGINKTTERNITTAHEIYQYGEIEDELTLRFKERKRMMHKVCADEINSTAKLKPVNHWEFLINHKFKLMWCSIFKSASSSWFDYFLTIAGKDPHVKKNSDVELARKTAYPRPSLDELLFYLNDPSYTSFVIIREPFERILSSYQDKITNHKLKFYQNARCRMAKERRHSRKCYPSFPQFVDFIVQEHAEGKRLDEHWMPYTHFCSLCQVNYTYVLKFEYLQEEQNYLVNHVPGLEKFELLHEHASRRDYSSLVREHYSQLTREQLDSLVNVYRDDFLISGHSWLKYYDFIQ
ncbi:Sulfotransferase [Trinorchestia longiramus]|nr:Sulfotransferase [Trinorchestia longiramus]